MINIAFIGAGRMGTLHARELMKIKDCRICGIFDPDEKKANEFCNELDVKKKYSSEQEIATDSTIDGVVIANYTDLHAASLTLQLNAGKKKIFCEKPIVRNFEDGEKLLNLEKEKGATVLVGHHRRYMEGFSKIHDMVQNGTLGKIRMAKINWCSAGYCRDWNDFFANFERSGGVILDMMSHMFDQLNWNFGKPASVYGRSIMLDKSMPQPMDYVSGTVTYKDGPICNIDCSWQRYGISTDIFEVYGDNACAIYDFSASNKLHIYKKNEHTEINLQRISIPIMEAFIDMIKNNTAPRVSLIDGLNAAKVALAMAEAAIKDQIIKF